MMGRPITEEHSFIVGRSALVVHPFGYGGDESGAFTASVFRQYQVETMRRQVRNFRHHEVVELRMESVERTIDADRDVGALHAV